MRHVRETLTGHGRSTGKRHNGDSGRRTDGRHIGVNLLLKVTLGI